MNIRITATGIDRRNFLVVAAMGGAALVAGPFLPSPALAARADVMREVEGLTGGAKPKSGGVRLELPTIAEYGDTVPLTIEVESPMTDDDYVDAIYIFAEENPLPNVVTFNFTPMSGRARVSTRIRLAKTQDVVALARTSGGEFYMVKQHVRVTIGGCG